MFILARALTYAAIFIGFFLLAVPSRILTAAGISRPASFGAAQAAGLVAALAGGALALACVVTFAIAGRGTPAPFDPPRRLVVRGPYRRVRNPMYIGAGLVLLGAALFYQSVALLGYTVGFLATAHLFVIGYEEPTLRRTYGQEYAAYCRLAGRWWPRRR